MTVLTVSFDDVVLTDITVYVAVTVAIVIVVIAFCIGFYTVVADTSAAVIFTVSLYCSCFAVIVDVVIVVAVINYKFCSVVDDVVVTVIVFVNVVLFVKLNCRNGVFVIVSNVALAAFLHFITVVAVITFFQLLQFYL